MRFSLFSRSVVLFCSPASFSSSLSFARSSCEMRPSAWLKPASSWVTLSNSSLGLSCGAAILNHGGPICEGLVNQQSDVLVVSKPLRQVPSEPLYCSGKRSCHSLRPNLLSQQPGVVTGPVKGPHAGCSRRQDTTPARCQPPYANCRHHMQIAHACRVDSKLAHLITLDSMSAGWVDSCTFFDSCTAEPRLILSCWPDLLQQVLAS